MIDRLSSSNYYMADGLRPVDYLPYDSLLNDWWKELLKWFNVRKFNISSDKLPNIFATKKKCMSTSSYKAQITFADVEKGKNICIMTFKI